MHTSERERLMERHRYSEWAGRSTVPAGQIVRQPIFTGDELAGYRLERTQRRELPEQPPCVTSFWHRIGSPAVIRVDVFECSSIDAAHAYLIEALGEFESAGIGRRTDVRFGDVAFGTDSVALFARGNLVILVRKATPQAESVADVAETIDAIVVGRPRAGSAV